MPNYSAVENITNYFNAATKLKDMNLGDVRSGTALKKLYKSPELFSQALKTIADAAPVSKSRSNIDLYDEIDKGTLLLSTYHELNAKINKNRGSGFKADDIIDIARIIKPVMPDNNQTMIEKLLKIYEILNS